MYSCNKEGDSVAGFNEVDVCEGSIEKQRGCNLVKRLINDDF